MEGQGAWLKFPRRILNRAEYGWIRPVHGMTMENAPMIKRLVGRGLLEVCEHVPALKPTVRKWGLRTSPEWFKGRVVQVQMTDGTSFKLASLAENYLSFELFWRGVGYY